MATAADLIAKLPLLPAKVAALCVSAFARLRLTGVIIGALVLALTFQTFRLNGLTIAPKAGAFHFTLLHVQG